MPVQNAAQIKEKIISVLNNKGPTIPVYIAKDIGLSMLFTSAFLSELLSDKRIKMSHMRVGNSPVYFIRGQESQLERFSSYLRSKEKDAFHLIQERKFLKDSEQSPAIRVALREIKDFAIPFKKNGETFWRYMAVSESNFNLEIKPIEQHKYIEARPKLFDKEERKLGEKIIKDIKIEDIEEIREDNERLEKKKEKEVEKKLEEEYIELPLPEKIKEEEKEVEEKEEPIQEKKKVPKEKKEKEEKPKAKLKEKKIPKKKAGDAQKDKFFEKIKEFLSKETVEILNIESFNKNEILLKIKSNGIEKLLIAYNKKKISDNDIINANKKASQLNLKYVILSMGEPSKKLLNLIEAAQNLDKIEKIEK